MGRERGTCVLSPPSSLVHFDAAARHEEVEELPRGYREHAFFGVKLELGGMQAIEGFRQVPQEGLLLSGLDRRCMLRHCSYASPAR